MRINKPGWIIIKLTVFWVCLLPFILLGMDTWRDNLGPNPIETLHFRLGDWALRFLCLTLFITPYRQISGQNWVNRFRRMIGLYAFFYAFMHFLVFIVLDLSLSWEAFKDEVSESPYILFGLLTFSLLLPMALTSTKSMQKRLGKTWGRIHKLIYVAAITALLHYMLLIKSDLSEALIYADIILILLTYRLFRILKKQRKLTQTA